ncbi:MAG: hypothetical protein M1825_003037 [Sarcosagium campestre]|nr:MAG: hypothetical protein M1825_003037 [Sarcosagium campestre]
MDAAATAWDSFGSVRNGQGRPSVTNSSTSPEPRPAARESSHDSDLSNTSRVAHTLTACCRCRQRKTRCDAGLPKCDPCERSGSVCEYFDPAKGKRISRSYVIKLQDKVRQLEEELENLEISEDIGPDTADVFKNPGLVKFEDTIEPQFLGSSSGIAMSRLVMELAKSNTVTNSIREIVPDVKNRNPNDWSPKPLLERQYPMLSATPAEELPRRHVTDKLTDIFCQRAQFLFPTLHEPSLRNDIEMVYNGSTNPYKNFVLRMVVAISLQKLDIVYAGLADSYYLAALSYMEAAIQPMDLGSLQCFALIGQYSLLTPTRTAVYYVIGLAVKLCQQMGLHSEKAISHAADGSAFNVIEQDLRRRLFWIITSMEYALAHALGRPSAVAIGPDRIDVAKFSIVDDKYITPDAILPAPRSPKKIIALHFLEMRILQAEIRRKLYQKRQPEPKDDSDPWFVEMEAKLEHWKDSSPRNDEGSGHTQQWFNGRCNTVIVFLFRPSPQIPHPSIRAATRCYDACAFNITMQRTQIEQKAIDISWVFVQGLCMAINTVLWTMSYPHIRRLHPQEEQENLLNTALDGLIRCSDRWPGVASAHSLYQKLVKASLKVYDQPSKPAQVNIRDNDKRSPTSFYDGSSPSAMSSLSNTTTTSSGSATMPSDAASPFGYIFELPKAQEQPEPLVTPPIKVEQTQSNQFLDTVNDPFIDPASAYDLFQSDNLAPFTTTCETSNTTAPAGPALSLGQQMMISEPNPFDLAGTAQMSQYIQQTMQQPLDALPPLQGSLLNLQQFSQLAPQQQQAPPHGSLSYAQQLELMDNLETDGMQDIGVLLDQGDRFLAGNW